MRNIVLVTVTALAVLLACVPLYWFGKAAYDMQFWSAFGVCVFMAFFLVVSASAFVYEDWR